MHLHILGICGTFMGGIAALAREAGHRVTGCDANVYPPMSTQLQALGIELIEALAPTSWRSSPMFVIGNVVTRGERFPLMEAILDAGLPYVSGPQWLAEHVLQGRHVLAVAGTHGKTTTTSMLAWILEAAGQQPGFPGRRRAAELRGLGPGLGKGQAFVIEADEYDTAFFDKRSKFVHYRPAPPCSTTRVRPRRHLPGPGRHRDQFHHLVRNRAGLGRLVVNARDEALQRVLARGQWSEVQRFGAARGTRRAARAGRAHADVLRGALKVGRVEWALMGEHNQLNALAPSLPPSMWAWRLSKPAQHWPASERAAPHGVAR